MMRIFKCDNTLSETIHMNQVETSQITIKYGKVAKIRITFFF
jgi:hypothetical protein